MFMNDIKCFLILAVIFIGACASNDESSVRDIRIPRGELSIEKITSISVEVGEIHGFSERSKDPEKMKMLYNGNLAAFVWLSNDENSTIIISTLTDKNNISISFFGKKFTSDKIDAVEKDFRSKFSVNKT